MKFAASFTGWAKRESEGEYYAMVTTLLGNMGRIG
jgi:hypothetical protein